MKRRYSNENSRPPTGLSFGPGVIFACDVAQMVERRADFYLNKGKDFCEGFLSGFHGLRRFFANNYFSSSSIDYHAALTALKRLEDSLGSAEDSVMDI
jgi:hypothetical protein